MVGIGARLRVQECGRGLEPSNSGDGYRFRACGCAELRLLGSEFRRLVSGRAVVKGSTSAIKFQKP